MGSPPNVILVGFMGSGKTATGMVLASRLKFRFTDMDATLEAREGMKVAEIFRAKGEPYFREKERALVAELAGGSRQVVATGGGVWMGEANRRHFLQNGWCVWLKVSASVAWERVKKNLDDRPLLASSSDPLRTIGGLLETREPVYALAPVHIPTDHMTPGETAEAIIRKMREAPPFDLPELQA